jgi:hypothetical protein
LQTDQLVERVLDAFRKGDLDECIRRARALVFAAPLDPGPRHMLAVLYGVTGRARLAVIQYRSLLPQALENGELFRAITIRKRMDALDPAEAAVEDRWDAIRRGLRARGFPGAASNGQPWAEAQALALTGDWFHRIVTEARVHTLEFQPRPEDVEAPVLWYVMCGRVHWTITPPNEAESVTGVAAACESFRVIAGSSVRVEMKPELPAECLRFDAPLARGFQAALDAGSKPASIATPESVADDRPTIPVFPGRLVDPEAAAPTPVVVPGPPRLTLVPREAPPPQTIERKPTPEWIGPGLVALPDPDAPTVAPEPEKSEQPALSLPIDPKSSAEPAKEGFGWFGSLVNDVSKLLDRRRHRRVPVSFKSRMALVRLKDSRVAPIRGEICDLSISGLGVRLTRRALGMSRNALANAVVSVELDMPGPEGPLIVAGHVRRIEIIEEIQEARIGIEFVLLTEEDRARINATIAGDRPAVSPGTGTSD